MNKNYKTMKKNKITEQDYIKINRALSRVEEMETLGPGFHSKNKIHKSKKTYSRKDKHKKRIFPSSFFFAPFLIS